jgi:hypothetical protein
VGLEETAENYNTVTQELLGQASGKINHLSQLISPQETVKEHDNINEGIV